MKFFDKIKLVGCFFPGTLMTLYGAWDVFVNKDRRYPVSQLPSPSSRDSLYYPQQGECNGNVDAPNYRLNR